MRVVLPSWDGDSYSVQMSALIEKLFALLGRVLMTCTGMLPIDSKYLSFFQYVYYTVICIIKERGCVNASVENKLSGIFGVPFS